MRNERGNNLFNFRGLEGSETVSEGCCFMLGIFLKAAASSSYLILILGYCLVFRGVILRVRAGLASAWRLF